MWVKQPGDPRKSPYPLSPDLPEGTTSAHKSCRLDCLLSFFLFFFLLLQTLCIKSCMSTFLRCHQFSYRNSISISNMILVFARKYLFLHGLLGKRDLRPLLHSPWHLWPGYFSPWKIDLTYSIQHFTFSSLPSFQTLSNWIFPWKMTPNLSEDRKILDLTESMELAIWWTSSLAPVQVPASLHKKRNFCRWALVQRTEARLFREISCPFTPISRLEISSSTVPRKRRSTEVFIQHTKPESSEEDS